MHNKMNNNNEEPIKQNNNFIASPMNLDLNMNFIPCKGMEIPGLNMNINNIMPDMNNVNNQMLNFMMAMKNQEYIKNEGKWALIFDNYWKNQKVRIKINPDDTFEEAVKRYFYITGVKEQRDKYKFVYHSKDIYKGMKISDAGLQNESEILVINLNRIRA